MLHVFLLLLKHLHLVQYDLILPSALQILRSFPKSIHIWIVFSYFDVAYYKNSKKLAYFDVAARPASFSLETDSWVYLAATTDADKLIDYKAENLQDDIVFSNEPDVDVDAL